MGAIGSHSSGSSDGIPDSREDEIDIAVLISLLSIAMKAPQHGIDSALTQFGTNLSTDQQSKVRSMTADDFEALKKSAAKLTGLVGK